MATINLSDYNKELLPDSTGMKIGIAVSEWNSDVTENLLKGAREALTECGVSLDNIYILYVPGSFELPLAARLLFENKSVEAVICLGAVIKGETPHFDFVSAACANGITETSLKYGKPVVFGVLTTLDIAQAHARSGGALGNKGIEAAITAVRMIGLQRELEDPWVR